MNKGGRELREKDVNDMERDLDDYLVFEEIVPEISNLEGIESPFRLYRYDKGADRFYFLKLGESDATIPVLSVTSFTQKVLNNSAVLMKWQDNIGGWDVANYVKNMRAEYGTFLHIIYGEILKTGEYDFDNYKRRAWETAFGLGYRFEAIQWAEDIVDDVVGFMMFLLDRKVEVIGLEFPIGDSEIGLGGCMDLICRLNFGVKKVNAIVDFKSGRKGFFEGHELQLGIYKLLWNRIYGGVFNVSHVFNFAPTSSENKEKYKLKNQTESLLVQGAENEVMLCKSRGMLQGVKMAHISIKGGGLWKDFKLENHIIEFKI